MNEIVFVLFTKYYEILVQIPFRMQFNATKYQYTRSKCNRIARVAKTRDQTTKNEIMWSLRCSLNCTRHTYHRVRRRIPNNNNTTIVRATTITINEAAVVVHCKAVTIVTTSYQSSR
uniref:Uncharacterized protein n=2 Tax=Cacopsylla melanoneura TaxID=428564 RepID=A0A8D9FI61_9HEMI